VVEWMVRVVRMVMGRLSRWVALFGRTAEEGALWVGHAVPG
jgi:hypothetical protein